MRYKPSQQQLRILREAINRRWRPLAEGREPELSRCPLCKVYLRAECKSCPIYACTGEDRCFGTHFYNWLKHIGNNHAFQGYNPGCTTCRRLAKMVLNDLLAVEKWLVGELAKAA
jgi:hypothetical protein